MGSPNKVAGSEEQREELVRAFDEQLVRAARVFDVIRRFPMNLLQASITGLSSDAHENLQFKAPYVVLRAQYVKSDYLLQKDQSGVRKVAARMAVLYGSSTVKELKLASKLPIPTPKPDRVFFGCYPVAEPGEATRFVNRSFYPAPHVSGGQLDLYPWIAVNLQAYGPRDFSAKDEPAWQNWDVFKEIPATEIVPIALLSHQADLTKVTGMLDQVSSAINDRQLNPRR